MSSRPPRFVELTVILLSAVTIPVTACRKDVAPPASHSVAPPPSEAVVPPSRLMVADQPCMGTRCIIKVWHHDTNTVNRACARAFGEIDRVEVLMSDWREDSELSRINQAAGKAAVPVSADTLHVIQKGLWLGELTDGRFDITVGAFRGLWKFDEDKDGTLSSQAAVKARLSRVNYRDVLIDEAAQTVRLARPGQRLTLGGIAKGYAVDLAVNALRAEGVHNFIVQAGGDLFAGGRHGDRDWVVGVQDPRRPRGDVIYTLALSDRAFNTSGDYERFVIKNGKRYHHILDARTGFPVDKNRSVTLLAPSAFMADLLDTALFTLDAEAAMKIVEEQPDVEAVIVDGQNQVHVSSGLRARLVKIADPSDGI